MLALLYRRGWDQLSFQKCVYMQDVCAVLQSEMCNRRFDFVALTKALFALTRNMYGARGGVVG